MLRTNFTTLLNCGVQGFKALASPAQDAVSTMRSSVEESRRRLGDDSTASVIEAVLSKTEK